MAVSWKVSVSRIAMLVGGVIAGLGALGWIGAIKHQDNSEAMVISGAILFFVGWFASVTYGSPESTNQ